VIIGRTGLHEFAFGFSSENPHWGPVRNPWDPSTSTGGSSGGSAGAVAAGIAPIAIGTDTGGSVRVPAALCGTYGLKVTYGRIPLEGVFPLVPSIDTVGPLADSVENLALAYRVMSGESGMEPPDAPLRLGIPQPWVDDAPLSGEVGSGFTAAIATLEGIGHQVVPIEMPDAVPSHHIMWAIAGEARQVHREYRERGEKYGEDVTRRLDDADQVTDGQLAEGRQWQTMLRSRFADALSEVDLLITPTVPVRAKVIGEEMIGDLHYRVVLSYFSALVNHALHPAIALPLAGTGEPPLSLQAIGPLDGENLLLGFARRLEREGISGFTIARSNRTSARPG
jgi:aspartyl-tRNA(Asn)/glutamyl-tRNA(Gln) amidotransferase subunit A